MIPLKLQLKNFVSYGSATQVIDFSPYNLICLSGKNGHGKSALLDALTWALWGQARKASGIAKADDGLLRLGQTHMMVCLDFICNNIAYRVRREYTLQGSKAITNVEFGIIDPETQVFRALTDKTIRGTQEKIETMIGLDYNSFTNSAFLRQGQANEFSKKTPKDRKEILATILGLEQFERIRKRAADKAKEAYTHKNHIERTIETLSYELQQKETIEQQLKEICARLNYLQHQEAQDQILLQDIKQQYTLIGQAKIAYEQRLFELAQVTNTIGQLTELFIQTVSTYRAILRKVKKLQNYTQQQQELAQLQAELEVIHKQKYALFNLKEKHLELKQAYTSLIQQLQHTQQQELEKQKAELYTAQTQSATLEQKRAQISQELIKYKQELTQTQSIYTQLQQESKKLSTQVKAIAGQEKQFERRKEYYHTFIAQAQAAQSELKSIAHKKALALKSGQPICPLCQQDLSQENKQDLCSTFEKQERFYTHKLQRLSSVVKQLKEIVIKQHSELEKAKKLDQEHTKLIVRIDELSKQICKYSELINNLEKALEQVQEELKNTQEHYKTLESAYQTTQEQAATQLETNSQRKAIEQELDSLEKDIQNIAYNPEQEIALQQKIARLQHAQQEYTQLLKESALQEQRKNTLASTRKDIKSYKHHKAQLEQGCLEQAQKLKKEHEIKEQEALITRQLAQLGQEKEQIILQKGALEQHTLLLEQRQKDLLAQKQLLQELVKTQEEYNAISTALSKDGIQALLIEDAIPEIEQEANSLLAKLTDNQAQLTIDSLRDLRNGNTKETLDIKISDAIGIRPYELFSGGEAFRIDFALRIAISKLLARRAGTSLQTLIIDEGFGSQDEDGLNNIMEALYKIQQDFAKIIIVSHLPTMKDQFPVHFLIQKSSSGSAVRVIENG